MRKTALALAALAGLALAGPAAAEPYLLDRSHAHVSFEVSHLGFSLTQGWFRDFDAEVDLDPEDVEATRVRFVIDAASVDTTWEPRDRQIRSKDFLDVARHPQIVFESTSVTRTGGETAAVTGNLTIRGETREVTLEARLNKLGPSPFDPSLTVAGFTVSGEIDRTEFGINYAAPAVGAVVAIEIQLELSPAG
ncbi:YceI family protein [Paralimibaculum aggregatum]|uniref:YceI family protein n=1 Tax=Paralimibaculum aggregatum TaxID=3036245 RepID=A0ABQ6LQI8_9RHOB|nr:YceI family protein [Limibaculum sp. NKW23]GMG82840.1 YceI family protein [Limibaculum sp. NKW23]